MSQANQAVASNGDAPRSRGMIAQQSRDQLRHEVDHLCHMLSEQGPMSVTFVHNNTLLGLQKQHFEAAITRAKEFMGGQGYLPNSEYRSHYATGRIADRDLDRVMAGRKDLTLDTVLAKTGGAADPAFPWETSESPTDAHYTLSIATGADQGTAAAQTWDSPRSGWGITGAVQDSLRPRIGPTGAAKRRNGSCLRA